MESGNPIWSTIAAVIAGCMAFVGVGLFFVRAMNIERRWLVALITLVGAGIGIYLLANQPVWAGGQDITIPLVAATSSILGFALGRLVDFLMGPRPPEAMKPDPQTYHADLAE